MSDNSATPPRHALSHELWVGTFEGIVEKYGTKTAAGQCAQFAAEVLKRCGDTDDLADWLDNRTLRALEATDGIRR